MAKRLREAKRPAFKSLKAWLGLVLLRGDTAPEGIVYIDDDGFTMSIWRIVLYIARISVHSYPMYSETFDCKYVEARQAPSTRSWSYRKSRSMIAEL